MDSLVSWRGTLVPGISRISLSICPVPATSEEVFEFLPFSPNNFFVTWHCSGQQILLRVKWDVERGGGEGEVVKGRLFIRQWQTKFGQHYPPCKILTLFSLTRVQQKQSAEPLLRHGKPVQQEVSRGGEGSQRTEVHVRPCSTKFEQHFPPSKGLTLVSLCRSFSV